MLRRVVSGCVFAFCAALLVSSPGSGGEKGQEKKVEKYDTDTFVPTDDEVIEKMFEMGKVNKKDLMFDLGCGDNRICFMACKRFGCRGVGIEANPERIRQAMGKFEELNRDGALVEKGFKLPLVETRHGDALECKDIGDATVVVMYMFPRFMSLWFPIAHEKLKPGTRILSHDYSWEPEYVKDHYGLDAWKPVAEVTVKSQRRDNHKVLMWIVPEKKASKSRGE